jgi:hypothetical protein
MYADVAQAAETGDLRGKVANEAGQPIAGATITVSGPSLAGIRTAVTADDGTFKVFSLPPGAHEMMAEATDHQPVRMLITVRLDQTVSIPVTLTESTIQEVVVVEAEQPVIDATRSAISNELDQDLLESLPVARGYQQAVNILPGVYGRIDTDAGGGGTGNPSVRGEGDEGNNVYIDGISTRDPATKTFAMDLQYDTIESIQVYTDGAPAEFGMATGMFVNVVTKDGGDEHHGTVGAYYSQHAWFDSEYDILSLEEAEEVATRKRTFHTVEIPLTIGGPIVKEKLWYYGALTLSRNDVLFEGADPETDDPRITWSGSGFGKLTWFPTPDMTFQYQLNVDGMRRDNLQNPLLYDVDAQQDRRDLSLGHILTAKWRPYPTGEFELKASYLDNYLNVVPSSGIKEDPSFHNIETGEYYGNADNYDYNDRSRMGAALDFTQLINDAGGDHRIKAGLEFWRTRDSRELEFTGAAAGLDGIQYSSAPDAGLPCDNDIDGDGLLDNCAGLQGNLNVGEVGNSTLLYSAFLQDDWSPIDTLTLNLGFRLDIEEALNNIDEKVYTQFLPAPRAGLAWDVTGDSKTLVSANYGRYYDIHGSSLSKWTNTLTPNYFLEYNSATDPPSSPDDPIYEDGTYPHFDYYTLDHVQDPTRSPLVICTDDSLEWQRDHMIELGYFADEAEAQEYIDGIDETYCDGRLVPYHMDKMAIGVEREIIPNFAVGARGIWSQTVNIPEDINTDYDTWIVSSKIGKKREYRALEFTATKKYDNNWGALASWTISESKGHMPGQFERASGGQQGGAGNDVGLFLDSIDDPDARAFWHEIGGYWYGDPFAWSDPYSDEELIEVTGRVPYRSLTDIFEGMGTITDDQGYYGYLPYHSFHQVKINGYYTMPWGTYFGVVYEFDSGHAWEKKGFQRAYRDYYVFPEGRGSRFMPAVHYIDFRLAQTIEFTDSQDLEISLDIFNLPGAQTPVTYYQNDVTGLFGKAFFRQAPRSMRLGVKYTF